MPQLRFGHTSFEKKWTLCSHECIFMEYDATSRRFHNYNRTTRKIIVLKDIQFDERCFPFSPQVSDTSIKELTPIDWPNVEEDKLPASLSTSCTLIGLSLQAPSFNTPCPNNTGLESQLQPPGRIQYHDNVNIPRTTDPAVA